VAHLARILIFPVKSLEPVAVQSATITRTGALKGDRAIAFFDERDKFVNGKKQPRVHVLRSSYDAFTRTIHLRSADGQQAGSFQLDQQKAALQEWLTEFFGCNVQVRENGAAGFPDDTDAPGPTLISTATLTEVASWFPPVTVASIRQRFRTNLELDGVPSFWEDRLYRLAGTVRRFQIGDVIFEGTNPCQRCAVPPRDPSSGEGYPEFAKTFARMREQTLPAWAERTRFNHFYRLAINTKVPSDQAGKMIHVGDEVRLLDE
jgi:uncharacterized protein YcbX